MPVQQNSSYMQIGYKAHLIKIGYKASQATIREMRINFSI